MSQNVAVPTFLSVIQMDAFLSSFQLLLIVLNLPFQKFYAVIIGIPSSGEFTMKEETDVETRGVCVVTTEHFLIHNDDKNYGKPLSKYT
jgi:hypothetical protein